MNKTPSLDLFDRVLESILTETKEDNLMAHLPFTIDFFGQQYFIATPHDYHSFLAEVAIQRAELVQSLRKKQ